MEQQIFDGIMDIQLFEGCGEIYLRNKARVIVFVAE